MPPAVAANLRENMHAITAGQERSKHMSKLHQMSDSLGVSSSTSISRHLLGEPAHYLFQLCSTHTDVMLPLALQTCVDVRANADPPIHTAAHIPTSRRGRAGDLRCTARVPQHVVNAIAPILWSCPRRRLKLSCKSPRRYCNCQPQ